MVFHMTRDCPELKNKNDENDVNNLIIGMVEVEGNDIKVNNDLCKPITSYDEHMSLASFNISCIA